MLGPALGAKNTICYHPELIDQQAVIEKIKHSQCVRDANAGSDTALRKQGGRPFLVLCA